MQRKCLVEPPLSQQRVDRRVDRASPWLWMQTWPAALGTRMPPRLLQELLAKPSVETMTVLVVASGICDDLASTGDEDLLAGTDETARGADVGVLAAGCGIDGRPLLLQSQP